MFSKASEIILKGHILQHQHPSIAFTVISLNIRCLVHYSGAYILLWVRVSIRDGISIKGLRTKLNV